MSSEIKNYLSKENNAHILYCSSSTGASTAENLLNNDQKKLWVSGENLPQDIIVDISQLKEKPKYFKCFGIHCWHDYTSNPQFIELSVSTDQNNFIQWQQFELEMKTGIQLCDIDPLGQKYNYLKISVLQTFGANKVYINELLLLENNPLNNPLKTSQQTQITTQSAQNMPKQFQSQEEFSLSQYPKIEASRQPTFHNPGNSPQNLLTTSEKQILELFQIIQNMQEEKKEMQNQIQDLQQSVNILTEKVCQMQEQNVSNKVEEQINTEQTNVENSFKRPQSQINFYQNDLKPNKYKKNMGVSSPQVQIPSPSNIQNIQSPQQNLETVIFIYQKLTQLIQNEVKQVEQDIKNGIQEEFKQIHKLFQKEKDNNNRENRENIEKRETHKEKKTKKENLNEILVNTITNNMSNNIQSNKVTQLVDKLQSKLIERQDKFMHLLNSTDKKPTKQTKHSRYSVSSDSDF